MRSSSDRDKNSAYRNVGKQPDVLFGGVINTDMGATPPHWGPLSRASITHLFCSRKTIVQRILENIFDTVWHKAPRPAAAAASRSKSVFRWKLLSHWHRWERPQIPTQLPLRLVSAVCTTRTPDASGERFPLQHNSLKPTHPTSVNSRKGK